jgi:hypothetical protein
VEAQLRPLRIGEILDVSINLFTRNFLTFLKILLVLVVPIQVLSVLIFVATVPSGEVATTGGFGGTGAVVDEDDVAAYAGGQIVIVVLGFLLTALATAACFKALSDAYLGARPNAGSSLRYAGKRLHSVVWIEFLRYLAVFLIFLIPALLIFGGGGGGAGLIFLFAIPFAIFLWILFAVAVPALLFEGCRGSKALRRSSRLVKTRWWPAFGALLAALLIAIVLSAILGALIGAVLVTDAGDSVFGVAVLSSLADGLAQLITTPFSAAVAVVLYYDLRVRKEGFDLELLAERLGVERSPDAAGPMQPKVPVWERSENLPPPEAESERSHPVGYAPDEPPPPPSPPRE